jgi:hypothetical protein
MAAKTVQEAASKTANKARAARYWMFGHRWYGYRGSGTRATRATLTFSIATISPTSTASSSVLVTARSNCGSLPCRAAADLTSRRVAVRAWQGTVRAAILP